MTQVPSQLIPFPTVAAATSHVKRVPSQLSPFTSAPISPVVPPTPGPPISDPEVLAFNADKPLFICNNILEDYSALPVWRTLASLTLGSDITDTANPTRRTMNRLANAGTSPINQGGGTTSYNLIFSLNPGTDGFHQTDSIVILGHNFGDLDAYARKHGGALSVSLIFADNPSFTINANFVFVWTDLGSFDNRRIVAFFGSRYSDILYACLTVTTTAADFGGMVPSIGEIILGRRRQLAYQPDRPYDIERIEGDYVEVIPKSRNAVRYGLHGGGRDFDLMWNPFAAGGDPNGLVQETEMRAAWDECLQGRKPVIFIPHPNTAPNLAYFVAFKTKDLAIPFIEAGTLSMALSMYEIAPFVVTENLEAGSYPV